MRNNTKQHTLFGSIHRITNCFHIDKRYDNFVVPFMSSAFKKETLHFLIIVQVKTVSPRCKYVRKGQANVVGMFSTCYWFVKGGSRKINTNTAAERIPGPTERVWYKNVWICPLGTHQQLYIKGPAILSFARDLIHILKPLKFFFFFPSILCDVLTN